MADVEMDRHYRILKRVIFELPPLTDETPEETALRQQLTTGVNEIRARRDQRGPLLVPVPAETLDGWDRARSLK